MNQEERIKIAYKYGEKAGKAAREGDWSRVYYFNDYMRKFMIYETDSKEERHAIWKSYDEGYKSEKSDILTQTH